MKNTAIVLVAFLTGILPSQCDARPHHQGSSIQRRRVHPYARVRPKPPPHFLTLGQIKGMPLHPGTIAQARDKLVLLETMLERYNIRDVEVLNFPVTAETPGTLFPIDLKNLDCYRLILPMGSKKLAALITMLSQLKIGPPAPNTPLSIDCRWGLVFHIDGEHLEVFTDAFGQCAYINGRLVKIDPSLLKFLDDNFQADFQ